MNLEGWLQLAAVLIPSLLIWVFRDGGRSRRVEDFGEDLAAFRNENRDLNRELQHDFKAAQAHAASLENRLAKLEEWRHATNNRLQALAGQVDEVRMRRPS